MWQPPYTRYSEDEIVAAALGHCAVMGASGARFSGNVLQRLPELRFISKFGAGVDSIDLEAATALGILVSNTPEDGEAADVAEHTIAMMLALKKRLLDWTPAYMRAGGWRPGPFAQSMAGDTIGLIGLGHIGRAVARRLSGWDVNILGFDPAIRSAVPDVTLTDLTSLLEASDIVSLHANPTSSNRHLIDAKAIGLMKSSSLLINTARASLIDTEALVQALDSGRIAGAAIDVYDEEPPDPAAALFRLRNLLATPHTAAWTRGGLENIGWHAARNLVAMLTGKGHADIVNAPAAGAGTLVGLNL
ncbi:MAG TPA: NAD(P)-dependent oxidoreductase [Steroidobacteraceae bacterium]